MIQTPCDGSVSIVEKKTKSQKDYVCVFNDETSNSWKNVRYHQNIPGTSSIHELYQLVSEKSNYKYGTFDLAYMDDSEEILIDYNCEDMLAELLRDVVNHKRNQFIIKQKDGVDPVNIIVDNITSIEQDTETHDVESYAGSFFKLHDNDEMNRERTDYALTSSSSSYTSYNAVSNNSKTGTKSLFATEGTKDWIKCQNHGFIGLVNQAMTCYLNSLLQTLFMTPEFRNALYRWRYKGKDSTTCIPFQLQKLFLKLETSKKKAVETTDLTKSFGWDSSEAWQQHDVQELCRVMFDALENTLKNTDQANLINQLYQGGMKDYVKCLKCGHENSRFDNYLDISVDIRPFGSKESHETLVDALQAFITPETLDGNNQYFCEECNSKQDAHKGLKFVSFPYLLTIQLKRFTFDFNTLQRIKLHDRLTFPYQIDLNDFIETEGEAFDGPNGCKCPAEEKDNDFQRSQCGEDEKASNAQCNNNTEDISKGPYIYELFSVLIHSGSALGGHYYAYIKSFDDGKWYCFNDQYVSEVSAEEMEKSYGGIDKHRGGYYSSNYSSSTNAYMLMYRQVDGEQNKKFVKKSLWSNSLTDLCDRTLKDELDEHKRIQREKDICNVRIYCNHPTTRVKMDSKLSVHKDKTLTEATEIAWKAFGLEEKIPIDQCRLVKYDDYNESYDRSYDGEEDCTMEKVLGGIRISYGYDLLLELRKEDEQFKVYSPGGTTLKVYVIDLEESEFDHPTILHVPLTHTVEQLKKMLEVEIGLSAEKIRIATLKEYHGFNLLENNKRTLKLEGFYKSAKIFVEGLCNEDAEKEFKESKFYERLEVFNNTITLNVTLPGNTDSTSTTSTTLSTDQKELSLNIDKRITLSVLKEKIAQNAGLEKDAFRVYRVYSNNQEFECLRPDEQLTSYLDDTKIIIKLGRALKEGEWRVKVYHLHIDQKEHFEFLMEAIIASNTSVKELKEQQIIAAFVKLGKYVPLERLRIRKKSYRNPCRVYPDTCIFDKDLSIGYTTELFAEILKEDERVSCDDDLSVYVRRWNPSTYTLDDFQEVVLHKDTTLDTLKKKLEYMSAIPAEFIHCGKGRGVFPCTISLLDMEHEIEWNPDCSKLGEFPYSISDDGAVIYYKNCEETPKVLTESEKDKMRKKERDKTPTSGTRNNYRKEKALKIYTNGVKR